MICVLYIFEEKRVKFDRKEAILLLLRLKCIQDVSSMSHNELKIILKFLNFFISNIISPIYL